jgi:hypothetical protein
MCIWHYTYTKYSLLIRESFVTDIIHTLIIHYSSERVVYLTFSIHLLLNTHQGELCMSYSPYTNYSLLIRESYLSDILHTLIINYSSGRVVHLAFSIHKLLITHQGELCIWHSPYTNWSLLIRDNCLSDILHTLNTHLVELCTSHSPYTNYSLLIRESFFIWHSPYTNYSLLIKESCVSDIFDTLITDYLSERVASLKFPLN